MTKPCRRIRRLLLKTRSRLPENRKNGLKSYEINPTSKKLKKKEFHQKPKKKLPPPPKKKKKKKKKKQPETNQQKKKQQKTNQQKTPSYFYLKLDAETKIAVITTKENLSYIASSATFCQMARFLIVQSFLATLHQMESVMNIVHLHEQTYVKELPTIKGVCGDNDFHL